MNGKTSSQSLLTSLKQYGSLSLVSEGVAVMPDGWKVRFDIGQCAKFTSAEKQLSMLFQTNTISRNRVETNVSIDTAAGEITSFHTMYGIGDSLNIIGIPGKVFDPAMGTRVEYVFVLTPRLLRLVK